MPHVKQLMADHPDTWMDILINEYKISIVKDSELNTRLISARYDQISSPMHEPIVQECRGMVIDIKARKILGYGFRKFWNLSDPLADKIDWATAICLDKADGSLMQLFHDDQDFNNGRNGWRVASSGHPTAGGRVGKADKTFNQMFWETFDQLEMRLPYDSEIGTTFCFELCRLENRVVVRHDKPRIVAHGARWLPTEREIDSTDLQNICRELNWEYIKSYPIGNVNDALKAAQALDPISNEGFVVVDADFNRVKIKSPKYLILHHLKGSFSARNVIKLWQTGEISELLNNFKEMEQDILSITDVIERGAARAHLDYLQFKTLPTRKDYADNVKNIPMPRLILMLQWRSCVRLRCLVWKIC